jgi:hypothetical protein
MLFDRTCRLEIGKINQPDFLFDERFRITFDITKSITSDPKTSQIQVYNLAKNTRVKLRSLITQNNALLRAEQEQVLIYLYAGYKEYTGAELLYIGNVSSISDKIVPPDIITTMMCTDNVNIYKRNVVSLSYKPGASSDGIMRAVAQQMNMPIDDASVFNNINFAHGFAFIGTAKDAFDNLAKQTGVLWTAENGKIRVIPRNKSTNESVIVISSKSGMINAPEKLESDGTDADTPDAKEGWKVTSLLQPKLLPGRKVKIESNIISGIYVIDSVEHKGDTTTGDWQSVIETKTEGL